MQSKEELQARRADLQAQFTVANGERRDNLEAAIGAIDQELAAKAQADENIRRLAADPANLPGGGPWHQQPPGHAPRWRTPAVRTPVGDRESPETQRKLAYLLVSDLERDGILSTTAADRLADVVDSDEVGTDSLYLRAISDPSYEGAFSKLLQFGAAAPARFTEDESRAAQAVFRAQSLRASIGGYRAAGLDTGTPGGGYAVPITLDPTVIPTSDSMVSPLRQLARTVTLAGSNTWKGVSSDGVEASFAPQGEEVGDGTPTLEQPTVYAAKAHAFVPYSMELESDWGSLRTELSRMLSTARSELEARRVPVRLRDRERHPRTRGPRVRRDSRRDRRRGRDRRHSIGDRGRLLDPRIAGAALPTGRRVARQQHDAQQRAQARRLRRPFRAATVRPDRTEPARQKVLRNQRATQHRHLGRQRARLRRPVQLPDSRPFGASG
jgi:capsid protein